MYRTEFHGPISGRNVFLGTQAETINFYIGSNGDAAIGAPNSDEEKAAACRDALFLTYPQVDRANLIDEKGQRVAGTCEWIMKNALYRSWLGSGTQLLWISGGPGKGKTMLSIFLTEELAKISGPRDDTKLIFYFCSHRNDKRNTAITILRGLLHQIITERPGLAKHVLPYFDTPERAQLSKSSLSTLWIIFEKILLDPSLGTIFCVLDGLDECDEDSLRSLVVKLVNFFFPTDSRLMVGEFKLVIVSREISGLRNVPRVKLDPDLDEQVTGDVQRVISVRIDELSTVEGFNEIRAHVQSTLLERAEGTFLWVGLVMHELSQKKTCTEILDTLRTLPKGLPGIYSRMLLQIESSRRHTASLILRWVMMALRPLMLEELAVAIDITSSDFLTRNQTIRDYITLCGSFLKIREQEVGLIHGSARDYLLRETPDNDPRLEQFRIKKEEAHFELARTCFAYIQNGALADGLLDFEDKDSSHLRNFPLLNYAMLYWPDHARDSSEYAEKMFDPSRPFFQKKSPLRIYWWRTYRRATLAYRTPTDLTSLLSLVAYLGILPWARKLLVKKGWNFGFHKFADKMDSNGMRPLFYAAAQGHEAMIRLLLDRGADVTGQDKFGRTALFHAALQGHEAVVRLLLDRSADINTQDKDGWTALIQAAQGGHEAVVRLLLDRGADVTAQGKNGKTVLTEIAWRGHETVIRLLLDRGADVNAQDADGQTALNKIAWRGDEALVRLLLDRGADVNVRDKYEETALFHAARQGHETLVRLLLDRGADVNAQYEYGWTALFHATREGHEAVARLLLDRGADVNAQDKDGKTALTEIAWRGHEAVVRLLLDRGADVTAQDKYGETALNEAARQGHEAVVRLLLDRGADVTAQDKYGETALNDAAQRGYEAVVRLLLDRGADITAQDRCGKTVLFDAARQGHEAVVRLLLDRGADVNAPNEYGWTALNEAARQGHEAVVRLLLDRGADVTAPDKYGWTVLNEAAREGHEAVVRLLLDRGADINAPDKYGTTALFPAAQRGQEAVVRLLLDRGADVTALNEYGETALNAAARQGREAVVRLLQSARA